MPTCPTPERILVLILTCNGARYVPDLMSSLDQARWPREALEILVVDNASTDESVAMIRRGWPGVRIVENGANLGFAAGNNVGLRYALEHGYDYVYLLNQDTVVEPDFLEEAVRVARSDPTIGSVQSKLLLFDEKDKINTIGNEIHYLGFAYAGGYRTPDRPLEVREITYGSGACLLVRVAALEVAGLFYEELFLYQEDVDLGWQLRLTGHRNLLAPRSVVYHKYEFSRNPRKFYFLERNRYLTIFQNYKFATLLVIALPAAAMFFGMIFYSVIAGFWREELHVMGYFCRAANWRKLLARRRAVQKNRRVPDREVVRFFTGRVEFEGLRNPVLHHVANPVFDACWRLLKCLICW